MSLLADIRSLRPALWRTLLFVFHPLIIEATDVGVVLLRFTVPPLYFSILLQATEAFPAQCAWGWGGAGGTCQAASRALPRTVTVMERTGGKNTLQVHYAGDFQSVGWSPVSSLHSQALASGTWAG